MAPHRVDGFGTVGPGRGRVEPRRGSREVREQDFGPLYQSADSSSVRAQHRFLRATQVSLAGIVAAAVGGSLTATSGPVDIFGLLALIGFLAALAAEGYIVTQHPDRVWYEGRAAAETAKSLAWRYMVGGEPFPVTQTGATTDALYLERMNDVLHDLGSVDITPATGTQQITSEIRRVRALPLDERQALYRTQRIEDQQRWYTAKSQWNAQRSYAWSLAALAIEFAGVVGAALKAFKVIDFDLLGVLAATAAAIAAWSQTKQHQTLQRAYFVASQELAAIASQLAAPIPETAWAQIMQKAEEAISREHTLWRASRAVKPPHP
jgi:hypothetical protein